MSYYILNINYSFFYKILKIPVLFLMYMIRVIYLCIGRTFPVEILYCKEPEPDYLEAALITGKPASALILCIILSICIIPTVF